jgi:ABC-type dipeptide/oligopeptide/nickel transport system permease component
VTPHLGSFILRRAVSAIVLVLVVSSAAVILARLAPGDHLSEFELTPAQIAAERHRLGLDAPLYVQYFGWLRRVARFDLGESTRYPGRKVRDLIAERIGNTAMLGLAALVLATALGIPLGVLSATNRRGPLALTTRGVSIVLLALPPVILSLGLLFLASTTGWFPVGGLPSSGGAEAMLRHLVLPVLALGLPVAATLERLQSRAMGDALRHPSVQAARARGIPQRRVVWSHALRLSLTPVLAVYGVIAATLISGSFAVEYVMTWPGLGRLLYDGLIARDANVVAGCAATGAAVLATGILLADVALAAADPRVADQR